MPRKLPKNPNSILNTGTPVQNYLTEKEHREQRLWKMLGGKLWTYYNGSLMDSDTFNKLFPLPCVISFNRSKETADPTQKYLQ